MRCIRQGDVEISKDIVDRYDLDSPEGRLEYILREKDGFAPVSSNGLFAAMGGKTEHNKVVEVMYKNIDDFLEAKDLRKDSVDLELLSEAKVYSLDGIFTTLTSVVDMSRVLRSMRKDPEKLEAAFEKVERNFISFVETLAVGGVTHFSYADPAAMPEIMGRYYEGWIVERFVDMVNKLSHMDIALHICPVLFMELRGRMDMKRKKCENYQETFFREIGFRIAGGSCIKNKERGTYYFTE